VSKMGVSFVQMVGVLGIFRAKGTRVFNEAVSRPSEVIGGSFASLLPVKCALGSQIYGTFVLNMALPPVLLAAAALIMIPTAFLEKRARSQRAQLTAPRFKGTANIPRSCAVYRITRTPMTAYDVEAWSGPFHPIKRYKGVAIFLLFFMCVFSCTRSLLLARLQLTAFLFARSVSRGDRTATRLSSSRSLRYLAARTQSKAGSTSLLISRWCATKVSTSDSCCALSSVRWSTRLAYPP